MEYLEFVKTPRQMQILSSIHVQEGWFNQPSCFIKFVIHIPTLFLPAVSADVTCRTDNPHKQPNQGDGV